MALEITTNNVPRLVIDGYELTQKERAEFDYYRWPDVPASYPEASHDGTEAEFFRYKGRLYDLGEFMTTANMDDDMRDNWHGYSSDSFFSGILVRYVDNGDRVIVGSYYA